MDDYEVSEICDPVAGVNPGPGKPKSVFTKRVEDLPVGKAFVVTGMIQSNASSRARQVGLRLHPQRKFSTASLGDGRIQITRIS